MSSEWDQYKKGVTILRDRPKRVMFRRILKKHMTPYSNSTPSNADSALFAYALHTADALPHTASAGSAALERRDGMMSLDLHGLCRDEAYIRVLNFIRVAKDRGERKVLIITGGGEWRGGVLRKEFQKWALYDFKHLIDEVLTSAPKHGGEGAFYVFIRR